MFVSTHSCVLNLADTVIEALNRIQRFELDKALTVLRVTRSSRRAIGNRESRNSADFAFPAPYVTARDDPEQ